MQADAATWRRGLRSQRERSAPRRVCSLTNESPWSSGDRHTVKFHLASIYRKLGAANRTDAIVWAVRAGMDREDVGADASEKSL